MDRKPSPVRLPLHSDVSLLAERRRELLCETHQKAPQARRVSLPPGSQRCHPPLPRRHQCKPKALCLDQGPQQNHRRRQARVPSVRFDPLGAEIVVLSPELPTFSAELAAKHKLTFPVLNDHGLTIAKAFGLVFTLPDDLKDDYLHVFTNDLAKRNGEPSWQLPMAARFVIDRR